MGVSLAPVSAALGPATGGLSLLAPLAGAALGGLGNFFGAQQQNQANMQMVQQQEAFQQKSIAQQEQFQQQSIDQQESFQDVMSSTAYQRATKDMVAAGLNPMLAYMQGGASAPSGGSASGASASGAAMPMVNELGPAVTGAMGNASAVQQYQFQQQLQKQNLANLFTDTQLKGAMGEAWSARQPLIEAQVEAAQLGNQLLRAQIPQASKDASAAQSWLGTVGGYLHGLFGSSGAGPLIGAAAKLGAEAF